MTNVLVIHCKHLADVTVRCGFHFGSLKSQVLALKNRIIGVERGLRTSYCPTSCPKQRWHWTWTGLLTASEKLHGQWWHHLSGQLVLMFDCFYGENVFWVSGSGFPLTHIRARMEITAELGQQLGLYILLNYVARQKYKLGSAVYFTCIRKRCNTWSVTAWSQTILCPQFSVCRHQILLAKITLA